MMAIKVYTHHRFPDLFCFCLLKDREIATVSRELDETEQQSFLHCRNFWLKLKSIAQFRRCHLKEPCTNVSQVRVHFSPG